MKKDQLAQLKKKEPDELRQSVAELKEKLSRLLFDLKSGKTAVLKEIRLMRKDIAVHMTIMQEKQNKL
jgi:ribosomal protein L29